MIPSCASTSGRAIMPLPMHVPATNKIDPVCFDMILFKYLCWWSIADFLKVFLCSVKFKKCAKSFDNFTIKNYCNFLIKQ